MAGVTELPSGTVTFLFTDIEGSTVLVKRLGDDYAAVLDDHRRLLREAFAAHGGREIDTQGDSFFYAFARAKNAIAAAIDAQRALDTHAWPEEVSVRVRMGLHSGEPLVGEDRYVGIGVNRAARIGAAAHGGQVLVSDATRGLVEDDLPQGAFLRDLGLYRLKDIDRPERVSQIVTEGLQAEFPLLRDVERVKPQPVLRRRSVLAAAMVSVVAAAVAVPVFSLTGGGSTSAQAFAVATTRVGSGHGGISALVIQKDGKLVAAGVDRAVDGFWLVRYAADGSLDSGFGSGGVVTTDIRCCADPYALAVERAGKLIAAGVSIKGSSTRVFTLARYLR